MNPVLPRVTEILAAVGLGPDLFAIPPDVLATAQKRGRAVHEAIEALAYGYLDEAMLDPVVAPYLDAYRRFVADSGHEAIASEIEVRHPAWQYVGHADRIGWLAGGRVLLDWKSGERVDLDAAGYQLAAYRMAWNAMHATEPVAAVAVVQLRADATYRFHELDAADYEQGWLAALVVYRAQKGQRP